MQSINGWHRVRTGKGTGLRDKDKGFLVALCSAAALLSGAAVLALDHFDAPVEGGAVASASLGSSIVKSPSTGAQYTVAMKGPLLASDYRPTDPLVAMERQANGDASLDTVGLGPDPATEGGSAGVADGGLADSGFSDGTSSDDGRLDYVPHDMVLLAALSGERSDAEDLLETAAIPNDSENPDTWTLETRREITSLSRPLAQVGRGSVLRLRKDVEARLSKISPLAGARLREKFAKARVAWPPSEVSFVAIKDEKVLELYARSDSGAWTFVHSYPVLAASGNSGPKLQRGDRQVPEGVYNISFLNPNSRYHVSLRVSYPNKFDREMAARDGRKDLGGDIMIHGKNVSSGCLAVGDEAAEELFLLAARIGLPNVKVIIAPTDFRKTPATEVAQGKPRWVPKLYTQVASAMSGYKRPSTGLLSFFGN